MADDDGSPSGDLHRRQLLAATGTAAIVADAGCPFASGSDGGTRDVHADKQVVREPSPDAKSEMGVAGDV